MKLLEFNFKDKESECLKISFAESPPHRDFVKHSATMVMNVV